MIIHGTEIGRYIREKYNEKMTNSPFLNLYSF